MSKEILASAPMKTNDKNKTSQAKKIPYAHSFFFFFSFLFFKKEGEGEEEMS